MKTALVTGGSGDIGGAIVKRLAAAGYAVAFTYFRGEEEALRLKDHLAPAPVLAIRANLASGAEVERLKACLLDAEKFERSCE